MELLIGMMVLLPLPLLVRSSMRKRRRRDRLAQWGDHPVLVSDQPFRGYKLAQFVVGNTGAWLIGVLSVRYKVDESATCLRRHCSPPGVDCLCGFHAFRERDAALDLLARLSGSRPEKQYVLLGADLDGSVLEYEHGYRAERQRIVRIEIGEQCLPCLSSGQLPRPTTLVTHPDFRSDQLRYERDLLAQSGLPSGSAPIRALCSEHLPRGPGTRHHTLDELQGLIGTEVALLSDH